jgi:hypothetical protein
LRDLAAVPVYLSVPVRNPLCRAPQSQALRPGPRGMHRLAAVTVDFPHCRLQFKITRREALALVSRYLAVGLLRLQKLPCALWPVVIMGGLADGSYKAPERELLVMLQSGEVRIAADVPEVGVERDADGDLGIGA